MKQILVGHVSADTAYLQADYPYSFNLRCQRKVWIETRKGFGQRIVTQTENPKTGKWNKPKNGTYFPVIVMFLNDESGHVEFGHLDSYASEEKVEAFEAEYGAGLGDYERSILRVILARDRVSKKVTWEVKTGEEAKKVPSMEEQSKTLGKLVRAELSEMDKEDGKI